MQAMQMPVIKIDDNPDLVDYRGLNTDNFSGLIKAFKTQDAAEQQTLTSPASKANA